MRIAIVGPGIMPIPPPGWGAVEILIWELKQAYERLGAQVLLVNNPHDDEIVAQVNAYRPDVVDLQYDGHHTFVERLHCRRIVITSHYGYLENDALRDRTGYATTFQTFCRLARAGRVVVHCLSPGIRDVYLRHNVPPEALFVVPNGASPERFRYVPRRADARCADRAVYLGKIDARKRQRVYRDIACLDFAGNVAWDAGFDPAALGPRYLGEWSKEALYDRLTDYGALVLLSDGEAHPLVVCEALVAGLAVVVSEPAAANLDRSLPFVAVVPSSRLDDVAYVEGVVRDMLSKDVREASRAYGLANFAWPTVARRYFACLTRFALTGHIENPDVENPDV